MYVTIKNDDGTTNTFLFLLISQVNLGLHNQFDYKCQVEHEFKPNIWNTLVKTDGYTLACMLDIVKYTDVLYCLLTANLIWAYCTPKYST